MLHIVLVLVPRCKCLFVHTHRINFQANERCLWCSVIKMTSILHSIPFYSILFYSFWSCSLYYCLLTVYKYVVKGFNNYWCVHLLTWVLFCWVGVDWTLSWQMMASWAHWKWKNFMWILWCFHLHVWECSLKLRICESKCTYITIRFWAHEPIVISSIKLKSKLKLAKLHAAVLAIPRNSVCRTN